MGVPLSLESTRQEFALRYNGNLFIDKGQLKVAGRDTARLPWPSTQIRFSFGSGDPPDWRERAAAAEQSLLDGYLPIFSTQWLDRDIEFTQVAFAAPLWEMPETPFDMHGYEEMVCLVRITMRNTSDGAKAARLWFNIWPSESLTLEGDNLVALAASCPIGR